MRAPLVAIALVLGFAAPAGTESAGPRQDGILAAAARDAAARPDGLLVLAVLSPERAIVADPRTGEMRERELAGGTLCHGPLLVIADRVVYFDLRRRRLVARAAPLDRLGRDRPVGSAEIATPSATPGRLWLGNRRGSRIDLREIDVHGSVHARTSTRLARWGTLEAHVGGEFLTTRGAGLVLGRERIRDGWLLGAGAERFAWCARGCDHVRVWSDGDRSALYPPAGIRPQPGPRAAFSPDGRRLALPVEVAGKPRFAVVDVERNDWSIVPRARPDDYSALAWSPSGAWLYLAAGNQRLLASRGGTARPHALPIRTGGSVMSIATAASRRTLGVHEGVGPAHGRWSPRGWDQRWS
jgi:hypothetical protein